MSPQREQEYQEIRNVLDRSRRSGVLWISPVGARHDAGWRIPWPVPGTERAVRLEEVRSRLERTGDGWRVYYCEDGARINNCHSWLWPEMGTESTRTTSQPVVTVVTLEDVQEMTGTSVEVETDEESERVSEGCARDILRLLETVGRRLTLTQISDELAARGVEWSSSTIHHTAPRMRRRGELANVARDTDGRGRGYGLPAWQ